LPKIANLIASLLDTAVGTAVWLSAVGVVAIPWSTVGLLRFTDGAQPLMGESGFAEGTPLSANFCGNCGCIIGRDPVSAVVLPNVQMILGCP
jgi:hypothetical protein